MQDLIYWLGQFALAASSLFAVLLVVDLLSGATLAGSWALSAAYALAAAAVFTATRFSRRRRSRQR